MTVYDFNVTNIDGKQESGSNEKIKFLCQGTYDVHFDMFAKIDVNGDASSPLYKYLKKDIEKLLK